MYTINQNGEITSYKGGEKFIEIPNIINNTSVKSIGEKVFYNMGLEKVILPSSLEIIKEGAFAYNSLKEIIIPEGVKEIRGDGDEELNNPFSEFTHYVHSGAFSNNALSKIVLPSSLVTIGPHAFAENYITELELPESLQTIGEVAFYRNQLNFVIIQETLSNIGFDAFRSQNRQLKRVIILGDQKRFNNEWESIGFPKKTMPL